MDAAERPPHVATIELDLWVWSRPRAAAVLEQLVAALEQQSTDDNGGHGGHHRVRSVKLAAPPVDAPDRPGVGLQTTKHRAQIRIPLRLRLRAWRQRRRLSPRALALADEVGRALERRFLGL